MTKPMQGISTLLAVSSCKGGVGKSTVALNLAYSLAKRGFKVGLFDADIYGPSLPTLVGLDGVHLEGTDTAIRPLVHEGVALMSFGFTQMGLTGGPALMRGPMVSQIIHQLLLQTQWGELDYLVIDMPPGTGDIQLTLAQLIPLTAAVIVTLPQYLSFVDVVKGIQMFDTLKVPTVTVVENMSTFVCPDCAHAHALFGRGALDRLSQEFGLANTFSLPLESALSESCDAGTPYVLAYPESPLTKQFLEIGDATVREITRIRFEPVSRPVMTHTEAGLQVKVGHEEWTVGCYDLRLACPCARCVGEFSGKPLLNPKSIDPTVRPLFIKPVGNYAVGIEWSDGHHSLYPDRLLTTPPS